MTRPPFPYFGAKGNLASKIVALLPEHGHYVEPFAGSLAVLLAKPRADMETVNDIDGDIMAMWRVIRDRPEDLHRAMWLTPHSRAEYAAAYDLDGCDDLERARRVLTLLAQGRGSTLRATGWRHYQNAVGSTYAMPDYLTAYADRIPPAAKRLHGVSLECRDAFDVIADYGRHDDTCLYVDPPYDPTVRSLNYRHEMADLDDHRRLADALAACKAKVLVSGYPSDAYLDLYDGWARVDLAAWTGNGIRGDATKANGDRVETLWANYPLDQPKQLDLLDMAPTGTEGDPR